MPSLKVIIKRVAYPSALSEPDAWYILITDRGSCKGRMAWRPTTGEALILDGEWSQYKGERELAFKSARIDVPADSRDQLRYVCMRTQGLGCAAESLIWEHSGEDWQEIADGVVPRLKGKLYQEFLLQIEGLNSKSEEARVIAALMGKGATANMASAAWDQWQNETLGVVNADCFRLASIKGYGFNDVDKQIRGEYGIADDDARRIRAAVVYSLRRLTDEGDTVVVWEALYTKAIGMLGGYADMISECTKDLFSEGTLKAFPQSEGVSLAADWVSENAIWDFVENGCGELVEGVRAHAV